MQKQNNEHIQNLVHKEEYAQAFKALPDGIRGVALSVREQFEIAAADVIQHDPLVYKQAIIDALQKDELQKAANFLAVHQQIKDMLDAERRAREAAEQEEAKTREQRQADDKKKADIARATDRAKIMVRRIGNEMSERMFAGKGMTQKRIDEAVEAMAVKLAPEVARLFVEGEKTGELDIFIRREIPKLSREAQAAHVPDYIPNAVPSNTFADVEQEKFSRGAEELATEAFRKQEPHLAAWLGWMENKNQVPTTEKPETFIEKRVQGLARRAQEKKQKTPPEPLNAWESNALYHPKLYQEDLLKKAQSQERNKSFAHIIELIVLQIYLLHKDYLGVQQAHMSSTPEDMFRGSDIALNIRGRWHSVDITTSTNEEVLDRKKEAVSRMKGNVHLPNLKHMLVERKMLQEGDRLNVTPHVLQVDPDLFEQVAWLYMERLKQIPIPETGQEEQPYQNLLRIVWGETVEARRRGAHEAAEDLLKFAV